MKYLILLFLLLSSCALIIKAPIEHQWKYKISVCYWQIGEGAINSWLDYDCDSYSITTNIYGNEYSFFKSLDNGEIAPVGTYFNNDIEDERFWIIIKTNY